MIWPLSKLLHFLDFWKMHLMHTVHQFRKKFKCSVTTLKLSSEYNAFLRFYNGKTANMFFLTSYEIYIEVDGWQPTEQLYFATDCKKYLKLLNWDWQPIAFNIPQRKYKDLQNFNCFAKKKSIINIVRRHKIWMLR